MKLKGFKTLDEFLNENLVANSYVVSYGGKFSPFHAGHYEIYLKLCKKFGSENVYITTSDIPAKKSFDPNVHILNFNEKVLIMTRMFKIPENHIVKVVNNYSPKELLHSFPKSTVFITALGKKDADRLVGKYYSYFDENEPKFGYEEKGYVYVEENDTVNLSATVIREFFRDPTYSVKEKEKFFRKIYPRFDQQIFDMLYQSLIGEGVRLSPEWRCGLCGTTDFGMVMIEDRYWDQISDHGKKFYYLCPRCMAKLLAIHIKDLPKYFLKSNPYCNQEYMEEWFKKDCMMKEALILEGGSFGHLSHVYEDLDLSFKDLKQIIEAGLKGELEDTVEKTDGLALSLSYKNGKIVYARNKGHLKNSGEAAIDANGVKTFFEGRGVLSDAYNFAITDLENALLKLPEKELQNIFEEGRKFMHLEVMYSPNQITIPYGVELLVFHNVSTYDTDGNIIAQDRKAADKLAKMIENVNANVQKTFKIQGSPYIDMKAIDGLDKKKTELLKKIKELQKKHNLDETDTLGDYYEAEWQTFLRQERPQLNDIERNGLVMRWARDNKSFRMDKSNLEPENLEWAKQFEKNELSRVYANIRKPVELVVIQLGVEILSNIKTFLIANPSDANEKLKKELENTIAEIRNSGDESAIEKLEKYLSRLQASGGTDKIFPSEGIIFQRGEKLYKLTATFADVHHILGILRFKN